MFAQMVARNGNLSYSVEVMATLGDVQNAVAIDEFGVGIGAISMTTEREKDFDFSQSYFSSGLDVLLLRESIKPNLMLIFLPFDWYIWISATLLLFFSGHVIWWFESDYQPKIFPRSYLAGVNQGVWYAWGTLTKTKAADLRGFPSRMFSVGWTSLTIIYIAAYTANLATILMVEQLRSDVTEVSQLNTNDVTLAMVAESTAIAWSARNLPHTQFKVVPSIDDAWAALQAGEVLGILFDAPTLLFLSNMLDLESKFDLLGNRLTKDIYGFLLHENSPLKAEIDLAIMDLESDGVLDSIWREWFTRQHQAPLPPGATELSFTAFSGMFVIVGIGLAAAIVSYVWLAFAPKA
ncbi:bacterial extracellular solute-binding protein, family 3, partial [Thecamonas trahens ATCC 50062]